MRPTQLEGTRLASLGRLTRHMFCHPVGIVGYYGRLATMISVGNGRPYEGETEERRPEHLGDKRTGDSKSFNGALER